MYLICILAPTVLALAPLALAQCRADAVLRLTLHIHVGTYNLKAKFTPVKAKKKRI